MSATIETSDRRFLTETASTRQKLQSRHFSGLQSVTIFAPRWGVSSEDLILEAPGDSDDGTASGLSMAVYSAADDVTKIQAWWDAIVHHRTTTDSKFQVSMEIRKVGVYDKFDGREE